MNQPQQMQSIPAADQVEQLKSQLLEAYVQKENGEAAVKAASEKITAIRNVLAGIPLGEAVAAEAKSPSTAE